MEILLRKISEGSDRKFQKSGGIVNDCERISRSQGVRTHCFHKVYRTGTLISAIMKADRILIRISLNHNRVDHE